MAGSALFGVATTFRYAPCAGVHATRECDTVVRMAAAPHGSLHEALTSESPHTLRLATPSELGSHVWLEASMALDAVLSNADKVKGSTSMLDKYATTLETSTSNVDHEFLARPVLSVLGVWVGEQDIMTHLEAVAPHPLSSMAHVSVGQSSELPSPVRVLLVARADSRQDDAALLAARAVVTERLGTDAAVILRLGAGVEKDNSESLPCVVSLLESSARASLATRLRIVTAELDKVRRATRPSFRSWFGVSSTPKMPGLTTSLNTRLSYADSGTSGTVTAVPGVGNRVDTGGTPSNRSLPSGASSIVSVKGPSPSRSATGTIHRRRTSSMNGVVATPLFPPDSVESLSRHAADLLMLTGDFESAGDAYRLLASELSGLTGPAIIHEASAIEHASVALALADGSKREVGGGLERAIRLYAKAGRRELAVRAALRAANYCLDAGFPDSAAGVLDRALAATFPNITSSRAPAAGTFSESAAAVLLGRTSFMFGRQGLLRKASLYAYMAATKFSNQAFHTAAALFAQDVVNSALLWPGIRDEVDLLFGRAAISNGEPERAISFFSGVMSLASDATDVEVQSRAILGFFEAVAAKGASPGSQRWDNAAFFPVVDTVSAVVQTVDSCGGTNPAAAQTTSGSPAVARRVSFGSTTGGAESATECGESVRVCDSAMTWKSLEDDVLEDWDYFGNVSKARAGGKDVPMRDPSLDTIVERLRKEKESGTASDPGGSLEMKIQRMREAAETARRKRRKRSLLDSGAAAGEKVSLLLTLRNPLQFPVFVESMSAVVTHSGKLFAKPTSSAAVAQNVPCDDDVVSLLPVGDIVIMPLSSTTVGLEAVANKPGRLCFVGARWMFSVGRSASPQTETNAAAGFCTLERKGPRLNATRKQRASEVPMYAEDLGLTVDIVPPAPRLEIRFVGTGSNGKDADTASDDGGTRPVAREVSLRAGQKLQTLVEITNSGREGIDHLVYRAGTPHALFLDAESCDGRTSFEAIEEEGAHAALATPARVAGCLYSHLGPGESLRVPVWLFGSIGGESEVRMVVAYGSGRVRICRLECSLLVRPSVSVFPRFIRRVVSELAPRKIEGDLEGRCTDAYILGVEVEHSGKATADDSFHVDSVSVTSSAGWCVAAPPGPRIPGGCEALTDSSANTALRVNETATIFVVLSRRPRIGNGGMGELRTSSIPVGFRSIPTSRIDTRSASGVVEPMGEDGSGEASYCERQSSSGASRASTHFLMTSGHAKKMASSSRDAVYASVKWRSSSGDLGELYLPPLDPGEWVDLNGPGSSGEELGAAKGDNGVRDNAEPVEGDVGGYDSASLPVAMRVVHEPRVSHSFHSSFAGHSATVPAVVPVDLYVRNMSPVLIDATVSAPVAGGIADGDRGRFWAGYVDGTLRAIPPGIERRVCLSAVLDGPGAFDLAKLVTTVRRHRGLGSAGNRIPVSRAISGEVRVDEVVASSVQVDDVPHSANDLRLAMLDAPEFSSGEPCLTSASSSPINVQPNSISLSRGHVPKASDSGRRAVPPDSAWDASSSSDGDL